MPLAGISCRLTAMLIAACTPNRIASPEAAKRENMSSLRIGAQQRADHDEGEQRDQRQAQDDAEFFGRDREHEVGMAVRQAAFGDAFAGAEAEPAAVPERFHRGVDLKGIAGGRVHEALDAARDMRDQQISAEQSGGRGAGETGDPDHPHARDEEQRAPYHQDQHGLAEIRLHHQQRHQHQQQHDRHRGRRHFRPLGRFRKQPRRDHDERGLGGFGGLDVDAEQRDPAPRALDLRPERQRRHDQDDATPRTPAARCGGSPSAT